MKMKKYVETNYEVEIELDFLEDILADKIHRKFGSIVDGATLSHAHIDRADRVARFCYSTGEVESDVAINSED